MDHFIDVKVLADPEFKETILMSAVFSKLHRHIGLVAQGKIGVSFPENRLTLGSTIRIHATKQHLDSLQKLNWLKGLRDYTSHTEIAEIPEKCEFRTVKRVQAKSIFNKRKRAITKGWATPEEAERRIPDGQQKTLTLPFAELKSQSNGNQMRVYVEHGELSHKPVEGSFSSYGLSAVATIPWF